MVTPRLHGPQTSAHTPVLGVELSSSFGQFGSLHSRMTPRPQSAGIDEDAAESAQRRPGQDDSVSEDVDEVRPTSGCDGHTTAASRSILSSGVMHRGSSL